MELSIEDADTGFAEAATAASRGERVVVMKNGRPFVELVPAQAVSGMDFDCAAAARAALGLAGLEIDLPPHFDDSEFSRRVLGVADCDFS